MKCSLVMAIVNRTRELNVFLHSLDNKTFREFVLIVVDLNNIVTTEWCVFLNATMAGS